MAMTLTRIQRQETGTETYSRVEAIADGAIVADGTLIDLRGARAGASLYLRNQADLHRHRYILVNRDSDGNWSCTVSTTHAAATASNDTELSSYPHAIIGNHGQAVQKTLDGSITQLAGIRAAFSNAHEQFNAWGQGLDALARFYPQRIVNAGHDWLYWAGHVAAYMVANHNGYSWAQKMTWAETVISGAADITTPAEFYANTSAHTAPTRAKTWVNPATGAKVNLSAAVNVPGTAPTIAQLANGGWVNTSTF